MDTTQESRPVGLVSSSTGNDQGRRARRIGTRCHPLVASLAGGLQATFAAPPEDEGIDLYAGLIARLDRGEPNAQSTR